MLVARREDELPRLAAELGGHRERDLRCRRSRGSGGYNGPYPRAASGVRPARQQRRHPCPRQLRRGSGRRDQAGARRQLPRLQVGDPWPARGAPGGSATRAGAANVATIASISGADHLQATAPSQRPKYEHVAFLRAPAASLHGSGVKVRSGPTWVRVETQLPACRRSSRRPLRHSSSSRPRAFREESSSINGKQS